MIYIRYSPEHRNEVSKSHIAPKIEKLVKDAEAHAEEDKRRKELIEARNHADAMVYSVEKNIKEFGDKIDSSEKAKIEEAINKTKKAIEGDDVEAIKKAQDNLMNVSHKLAEAMYAKTAGGQGGPGAGGGRQQQGEDHEASGKKKDDDVVDADFEDVK